MKDGFPKKRQSWVISCQLTCGVARTEGLFWDYTDEQACKEVKNMFPVSRGYRHIDIVYADQYAGKTVAQRRADAEAERADVVRHLNVIKNNFNAFITAAQSATGVNDMIQQGDFIAVAEGNYSAEMKAAGEYFGKKYKTGTYAYYFGLLDTADVRHRTADAHCVHPQGSSDLRSSRYRVYFSKGQELISFFPVSGIAVNPRYSIKDPIQKAGQHDYAVLTLQQSVPKDQDIGAVIPFYYGDSPLPGGTQVTVVGFGTSESLDAGIIRRFGTSVVTVSDAPGSLVMKPGTSGQGVCSGDSGGPAIAKINGAPRVVGVASWIASNPFVETGDISRAVQMCKNLAQTNHASLAADGSNENKLWLAKQLGDSIGSEPASPKNLVAKNGSKSTQVRLTWLDTSNNETGFKIERKIGNGRYEVIHTTKANTTSYEDTVSGNRTAASYRVRATNGILLSQYSNQASLSGTVTGTAPSAPKNLVAIQDSGSAVTLKWEDTSKDETGFNIYVPIMGPAAPGQPTRNLVGTVGSNATSITVNTVDQSYLVVAFNNVGESEPASAILKPLQVPKSPSQLTAKKLSATSVQLNWRDMSTDESGFKVFKVVPPPGGSGKPTYSLLGKVGKDTITFTYKSAKAGDQYVVVAYNDAGESPKPKTTVPFPK